MSKVYKEQIKIIKCPICGKSLNYKYIENDMEFDYADYYCDDCEINLTIYCHLEEEDDMNNRINAIAEFAQRREADKVSKEMELARKHEECKVKIRALKPRIDELLEVGNACLENNISLEGKEWGGHEGYDTHQFITNSWSHLLGFVAEYDQIARKRKPFKSVGIYGGGACDYNLITDGITIKLDGNSTLHVLKRFVDEFDKFESEFYAYVDKVCKSK